MSKSTRQLARWIICLVVVEALLGAGLWLLNGDVTTGPRFRFMLIALFVNFPGFILAAKLGLLGQGWEGAGANPVLGCAVIFGFSMLFYTGCVWVVQRALAVKKNESDLGRL